MCISSNFNWLFFPLYSIFCYPFCFVAVVFLFFPFELISFLFLFFVSGRCVAEWNLSICIWCCSDWLSVLVCSLLVYRCYLVLLYKSHNHSVWNARNEINVFIQMRLSNWQLIISWTNSNGNRGKAKNEVKHSQDIFIWNSITFNLLWLVRANTHTNWNGWKSKLKIVLHSKRNCHHLTGKCRVVLLPVIKSHDMCFNPIEIISNKKKQARAWWWLDILFACLFVSGEIGCCCRFFPFFFHF